MYDDLGKLNLIRLIKLPSPESENQTIFDEDVPS